MDFNQSIFHQPMFGCYPPRQRRDHRLSGSDRYLGGQIADPVIDRFALAFIVIRGTHRGVSEKHLQSYLSEICYRFNRRFWEKELLDRLIQACISTDTITYKELTYDSKPLPNH